MFTLWRTRGVVWGLGLWVLGGVVVGGWIGCNSVLVIGADGFGWDVGEQTKREGAEALAEPLWLEHPEGADAGLPELALDAGLPELASERRPAERCGPLRFSMWTQESCGILRSQTPYALDAQGFIQGACPSGLGDCADREERRKQRIRVLALNRYGRGRLAGWCDGTTLAMLMERAKLRAYLAQTTPARIASVGRGYPCGRGLSGLTDLTHLGDNLPQKYLDAPQTLAKDWDALVLCARDNTPQSIQKMAAILTRFVVEDGKGLLLVMDYARTKAFDAAFAALSAISAPGGFRFSAIDTGHADLDVDLACVAGY